MKRSFFFLLMLFSAPLFAQDYADYLRQVASEWHSVGSAFAVVKDNQTVFAQGFGEKRLGSGMPIDTLTPFQIGSVSKSFTATLMAQLVEEGLVNWDANISHYLEDFRMYDAWVSQNLQVRDIFLHRTGLPAQSGTYLPCLGYDADDTYHLLASIPPSSQTRTTFAYNNITFIIAARIIEQVTGKSWEENLQERLLRPLGMHHTFVGGPDFLKKSQGNTPHNVQMQNGVFTAAPLPEGQQGLFWLGVVAPAGGICSTVTDLLQWGRFQLSNGTLDGIKILEPASMEYLHTGAIVTSQNQRAVTLYAPCWFVEQNNQYRVGFHTGATWGFTSLCAFVPELNLAMVWLSNAEYPTAVPYSIMQYVIDSYMGLPPTDYSSQELALYKENNAKQEQKKKETAALEGKRAALSAESYTGSYHHRSLGTARVLLEQGQLYIELGPDEWKDRKHLLTHENGDDFTFSTGEASFSLSFKEDAFALDLGSGEEMGLWNRGPIIGISASSYANGKSSLSNTYIRAIEKAGGVPLMIPITTRAAEIDQWLAQIDALMMTGGEDLDPLTTYSEQPLVTLGGVNPTRDTSDLLLIRHAVEKGLPVLGICRGEQLMNVAFGGTLYQDIPTQVKRKTAIMHNQNAPREHGIHSICVEASSRLGQVLSQNGVTSLSHLRVNSFHHQAVKDLAPRFKITAKAPDGVIEGIEMIGNPNVWGVQFHPEGLTYMGDETFMPIFRSLVESARK